MPAQKTDEDWFGALEDSKLERELAAELYDWIFDDPEPPPPQDSAEQPEHILLAEDDTDMRGLLARALTMEGYRVTECSNGIQLLDRLSGFLDYSPVEHVDAVITDVRMPGLTGLEILQGLQGTQCLPPTIMITAFGDEATHAEADRAGAVVTLDKPFEVEELVTNVRRILGHERVA